jgi:DNA ligase-associated metallophosphoesterase
MSGLVPGIHVFLFFLCDARTWMAGHRRAEATPSFRRLCPAMTRTAINIVSSSSVTVAGVSLVADLSGALFWEEQRLLVVSDLHLEKGSSFAMRGVLLPPYDTVATLGRLGAVIARHNPRTVIALGDSFHDRDAHDRLSAPNRDIIAAFQLRRDWIWISGNHDPALPSDLGGVVAHEVAIGPIAFRHEPTGASGEIAGHLHPKARVSTRGRSMERRCFASDGERAIMPAFGAYTGGLSIRDAAFAKIFQTPGFMAHVLGDRRLHTIAASRCY